MGLEPTTDAATKHSSTNWATNAKRVNEESNFEPLVYKTTALPLSYSPPYQTINRPELDSNQ